MGMGIYIAFVAVVVCGLLAHTVVSWAGGRGRWGTTSGTPMSLEAGAYRSGAITTLRDRPAPWLVRSATLLGRAWAAITALFFAPAGALGILVLLDAHGDLLRGLATLAWTLVVGSGFALSVGLVRAAGRLDRHEPVKSPIASWSYIHHLAVAALALAITGRTGPDAVDAATRLVLPVCAVGLGITLLFDVATRRAAAIAPS